MRLPLFCVLVFLSFTATAQSPASKPSKQKPPEEKRLQAKELFLRAETSYKAGDYQEASEDYQQAFEIYQEPALLYNAGQCQYKLGHYEDALSLYRRYLVMVPDSPLRFDLERLFVMTKGIPQEKPEEKIVVAEPPKPVEPEPEPPTEPELPKEPSIQQPERSAFIYTSRTKGVSVKVRGQGDEVFSCEREVSKGSPCLLKDLPKGELSLEMRVGKRASYKKSFEVKDGVEINIDHRGSVRRFVLLTSALFIAGSASVAAENKNNTWVLGLPFVVGTYWSMRPKHRAWNKVKITAAKPAAPTENNDALSLQAGPQP